jgi:hypothetical protein
MKPQRFGATIFLTIGLVLVMVPARAQAAEGDPCVPPTSMSATPEETAWRLFVASTCPKGDQFPYVTWETWVEQNQLYEAPASGALLAETVNSTRRFHASPLALMLKERKRHPRTALGVEMLVPQGANIGCTQGFFKRIICEEARLNPETQQYITANGLQKKSGQEQFVTKSTPFAFPAPSIEIKADWLQLSSCANAPKDVHIENIQGTCYALAGMHLISKLIDKWVWATFEPQNATTNPRRCQALGCNDSWGSSPAQSSGTATAPTPALKALMGAAKLASEWSNYRLDGVQVDFLGANGKPTILGNSIIEGENASSPAIMKSSSCITCHALSSINAQGGPAPVKFIVGAPPAYPNGYESRDFVWSLALAQ